MKESDATSEQKMVGVHSAFYDGSGRWISIATTDGRLILADSLLNVIKTVNAHDIRVSSSFFGLNDSCIITGGSDSSLKEWSVPDLGLMQEIPIDFSPYTTIYGYSKIVSCGSGGGVVIWDGLKKQGQQVQLEDDGANYIFFVHADTTVVVSSGLHGYEVDIPTGVVSKRFAGHSDRVYCIMPSNDKTRVVTSSADSTVRIFDRGTERLLYTSPKLDGRAYVSCFNHNDDLIAASTSSGSIYFLDTTLTEVRMRIDAFKTLINTIHYSPSGDHMVAGSEGGGAKIFDTRTGELLHSLSY